MVSLYIEFGLILVTRARTVPAGPAMLFFLHDGFYSPLLGFGGMAFSFFTLDLVLSCSLQFWLVWEAGQHHATRRGLFGQLGLLLEMAIKQTAAAGGDDASCCIASLYFYSTWHRQK
ncbi:uncharacterized protein F5Z01DRAFT_651349 [Emericellopsis atlantica]|uniref:Uncharacterized protein n=1 Tax=Emericellopsis atlantica TaxID=2614577 RepID=A0A9P8CQD2_9HYPO|nr:uncharacterized protein F5Z01DRAFT_651349 [Emericellopsis atlantica]KAG9255508.1 hypothetical protein F5Z01DRAFT_651349 [Emericellopsis atlantica]